MVSLVKLEKGDWVTRHPPLRDILYQVRGVDGEYVLLIAHHTVTKDRFNTAANLGDLALLRKKDGQRFDPPLVLLP